MNARIRTIACVGGLFFAPELDGLGFQVLRLPLARGEVLDWAGLCARAGGEPDLVLYLDRSLPPPLVGLERFPCLTAFWCIDSHIHSWYPAYAQAFDLCLVSLLDHLPRFRLRLAPERAVWLPPFASLHFAPRPRRPEWDLLFAGTVDPETTPGRLAFLTGLGRRFPGLVVRRGAFPDLFPRARLVLNIAERGDLNFRVFEALGCGACLITPRVGHGQESLFRHGEDLFLYDPEDLDGLLRLVEELLADEPRCQEVARRGQEKIEAFHRPRHRAQTLADLVRGLDAEEVVALRLAQAGTIRETYLRLVYLHWAEVSESPALRRLYLEAARGA